MVFTEQLGRDAWKPSTKGFQRMEELLHTPSRQCLYVGDNPAKDFVAPNRLGWRSIQLLLDGQIHSKNPPAPCGDAQLTVCSIDELISALQ